MIPIRHSYLQRPAGARKRACCAGAAWAEVERACWQSSYSSNPNTQPPQPQPPHPCWQSYSKNLGLYAERIGALVLVLSNKPAAERALSQLKRIAR